MILYQIFKCFQHGLELLRKRNNREWEMIAEKVKCNTAHKKKHERLLIIRID